MVTAVEAETLNHKTNANRQYCDQVSRIYNLFHSLSMTFILFKNVKIPIIVDIFTFTSRINTTFESLKARTIYIFQHFSLY